MQYYCINNQTEQRIDRYIPPNLDNPVSGYMWEDLPLSTYVKDQLVCTTAAMISRWVPRICDLLPVSSDQLWMRHYGR